MSWRTIVLLCVATLNLAYQASSGSLPSIVPGPRAAVIYYESAAKTPEFNRLTIALRDGELVEKLKPTPLAILDVTQNPQPDPALPLPSLYVKAGESVVYKGACPTTAPAVVEVIKSHGG